MKNYRLQCGRKRKQVNLNVPFVPTHVLRERMLASSKCRKRFEGGKKMVEVWSWAEILFAGIGAQQAWANSTAASSELHQV